MNHRFITIALTVALLLSCASLAHALDNKTSAPSAPAKRTPAAKTQLVDINSARRAELKTLPGISDAQAAKIIAGRPYRSKAQLVSSKILDDAAYENVRRLIVARQPYDDAAKNAATYAKKKQPPLTPTESPR